MYSIKNHKIIFLLILVVGIVGILTGTGMAKDKPVYFMPHLVTGPNGIVAASTSLAPSIGLKVLMDGGNAVDAAVTTAAMLTICEPRSSSIGGHGIMMLYLAGTDEIKCLDWGGFLPHKFTIDQWGTPPTEPYSKSPLCSIFPGTLAGWVESLDKYGTISLAKALEPVIKYAEEGVPVRPMTANYISNTADKLKLFPEIAKIIMPGGRVPEAGDIIKFKDLANTYKKIAEGGPDVFYNGELTDKIVKYFNENGSRFTKEEFANYKPVWRDTVSTTYRDHYEVFVPKCQVFSPVILTMLNIWENFDMKKLGFLTPEYIHLVAEANDVAISNRKYFGDPDFSKIPYELLTSKDYAKKVAEKIDMQKASTERIGETKELREFKGSTTTIAVVDKDYNVCLITQTIGDWFGSFHVVPGTGILLNNEGTFYDLEPFNGPNYPAAGKKSEHQMGGAIIKKDGKIYMGVGSTNALHIPLAIAQVIERVIDFDLPIHEAIDISLIYRPGMGAIGMEPPTYEEGGIPSWEVRDKLWEMGHRIVKWSWHANISGVLIHPSGVLEGGGSPKGNYVAVSY